MGVQGCSCRASIDATGDFTLPVLGFDIPVDFTVDIDICPECQLANSSVSASLLIDLPDFLPLPDEISVTFEGAPIGLPACFNGILEVEVAGVLTVNGDESDVTLTLRLIEATGQVCIELEHPLPIIGDSICINVGDVDIVPCVL